MPAAADRLPGIRFVSTGPPLDEALPRMDVALFVGFAAAGPIDVPVAIEQVGEFEDIFGPDLPLAREVRRGGIVHAYLAPAVRDFFRNGGRRCWIVRVAGRPRADRPGACSNRFPLPGLFHFRDGRFTQATAVARSEGSWSDDIRVATAVDAQTVPTAAIARHGDRFAVNRDRAPEVVAGDLLRIVFRAAGYVAFGVARPPRGPDRTAGYVLDPLLLFRPSAVAPLVPGREGRARLVAANGLEVEAVVRAPDLPATGDDAVAVEVELAPGTALVPGATMTVEFEDDELLLVVSRVDAAAGEGPARLVRVSGPALWCARALDPASLALPDVVERLHLQLLTRRGNEQPFRLNGLGLSAGHARFWAALPSDRALYLRQLDSPAKPAWPDLASITSPRFPLAGADEALVSAPTTCRDGEEAAAELCLPIGDSTWPQYLEPFKQSDSIEARNGLQTFDTAVFLDRGCCGHSSQQLPGEWLCAAGTNALLAQAEFLRYQSADTPQTLTGIYAGFFIDEVSLVCVPDAVHGGWHEEEETLVGPASPPDTSGERSQAEHPAAGGPFQSCDPGVLPPPSLALDQGADPGTIRLRWSGGGDTYTLEEALGPEFDPFAAIGSGGVTPGRPMQLEVYDRPQGEYAYRVVIAAAGLVSAPSNVVVARVEARRRLVLDETAARSDGLLDVQRALVRFCAARGDTVAVLALPRDSREDDAIDHLRRLAGAQDVGQIVPPLRAEEELAFSYAAVYHPWLTATDGDGTALRCTPPEGAICGAIAARSLARGAWVAPANDPLAGVVALDPPVRLDRLAQLQAAGLNVIRREPRGFLALAARTLSRDADLRPLNVRRLLALVRRRALRVGSRFVFEPNGAELRRTIERGFEQMLGELQARGAFAGSTRATSYQVLTAAPLNTPASRDQGRFLVDLCVAPSLPLTFLTVRLLQEGDRLSAREVR